MCTASDRLGDTATIRDPSDSTAMEERQRETSRQRVANDRRSRSTPPSHHNAERCRQRGCPRRFQRIAASLVLCLALSSQLFPPTVASPFPQSSNGAHNSHHHHQHHHHQQSAQHAQGASGSSGGSTSRSSGGSSGSGLGVYMIRSPESTIAPADDEVLFECELNLLPERLDWRFRAQGTPGMRKDYVYIGKNQAGYNVSTVDSRYKLRVSVSAATIGEYQCVAWFGASAIASIPARLTLATIGLEADQPPATTGGGGGGRHDRVPTMMRRVLPPMPQQQHFKVFPGNSIIIDCGDIVSNPPPIWSYYKDGITIYPNVTQIQTGRRLILPTLTQRDSGTYWCSAVNSITGSEVILPQKTTIEVEYVARSAPRAFTQPQNVSVQPGDTALLECPGVANPVPIPSWTRANGIPLNSRARIQDYGLQISNVHPEDEGQYLCRQQNGIEPALMHSVWLTVQEPPRIIAPPRSTLTNESDSLELECVARGSPRPDIYWMLNGDYAKWDSLIRTNGTRMIIQSVEKRHAGIVQCFARNEVGEASEGNLLQVIPKQIPGGTGTVPLGSVPSGAKVGGEHSAKRKGGKKHKHLVMIPPSRPNITRLSDESVMVRWSVPSSDGLPIQFFKVQYRMLGDPTKNIARTQWMTENEDIPPYTRSYEVNNLKSDHLYRFRIVAVYSNNDNKEGAASGKFHLQRGSQLGLTKNHLLAPTLTRIESMSQHAVVLHWQFPLHLPHPIDGFYAYYRPATTAGEYSKATVDSSTARHFKVDHLEPGTAYEFKLQSFTASAASDFSAILTGRTLKPPTPPPTVPTVIAAAEGADGSQVMPANYLLVIGCVIIVSVLVVLLLCCCFNRRKKRGHGADETDAKVHIPVDQNGFAGAVSNGGPRVHHKTRANGINGRMNITPNPLAQDGDKHHLQQQQQQQQQLHLPPIHHPATAAMNSCGVPTIGGPAAIIQQQQQQQQQQEQMMLASMPHRRTLERSVRTIPNGGSGGGTPTMMHETGGGGEMPMGGHPPGRNSSIRRTRRGSGSVPGSPRIGRGPSSEFLQQQQQQQQPAGVTVVARSPMPMRAAGGKRNAAARLGRAENMSSGSLNSIEV